MTPRKPKPKPRKPSGPTLEQRVANLEKALRGLCGAHDQSVDAIKVDTDRLFDRIAALESRDHLRDKSHDEPVSNANEVIGLYPDTTPVRHEWKKCSPDDSFAILSPRREHWWQFWRRA